MRWRRTARLRGLMAEADPEVAGDTSDLDLAERLGVWMWRVRQRAASEGLRLLVPVAGAGIGSGLALGAFRFLTTLITGETPGLFALLNFVYGGLLGAGLAAGHLVSGHLVLFPAIGWIEKDPPAVHDGLVTDHRQPRVSNRRQRWTAILSGALLCFLAYLFITYTSGSLAIRGKGLVLGMGAAASLALSLSLSLALERWPFTGLRRAGRIQAVALAAAVLAFIQAVFIFSGNIFQSLVFVWPAAGFRASLGRFAGSGLFGPIMSAFPEWYFIPALIDAALVGIVLMGGLLAGLNLAWKAIESPV
jgi:hypothetical protein